MAALMIWDGKLLVDGGKLAAHEDCCCSQAICGIDCGTSPTLDVSFDDIEQSALEECDDIDCTSFNNNTYNVGGCQNSYDGCNAPYTVERGFLYSEGTAYGDKIIDVACCNNAEETGYQRFVIAGIWDDSDPRVELTCFAYFEQAAGAPPDLPWSVSHTGGYCGGGVGVGDASVEFH